MKDIYGGRRCLVQHRMRGIYAGAFSPFTPHYQAHNISTVDNKKRAHINKKTKVFSVSHISSGAQVRDKSTNTKKLKPIIKLDLILYLLMLHFTRSDRFLNTGLRKQGTVKFIISLKLMFRSLSVRID